MTTLSPAKTLDCSGKMCPMPIVETSKAIKQIEVGQVLKVIATDAGSEADIPAWASQTGHKLIDSSRAGNRFIFHILRSK